MLDPEIKRKILTIQKKEITEHFIYARLSQSVKDSHNQEILRRISSDELEHHNFWEEHTGQSASPNKFKIFLYYLISRILGKTFGMKLMEKGEKQAQETYEKIAKVVPAAEEIAEDLAREGIATQQEFMNVVQKANFDYDFLKDRTEGASLEGYLFPDTYRIGQETNSREIITKMLENFDNKLSDKRRTDIKSQGKTIFEIIIMASLIEKEVSEAKDRPIVAGIFYNRLDLDQALESCATIQYILGTNKKRFSYEETRTESPYNTYTNVGLPPGPICNPGLPAIKAAIYSQDSEYLYFLSDNKGKTHYAKTATEHEVNIAKYLK